jgi:hypothetical protein
MTGLFFYHGTVEPRLELDIGVTFLLLTQKKSNQKKREARTLTSLPTLAAADAHAREVRTVRAQPTALPVGFATHFYAAVKRHQ